MESRNQNGHNEQGTSRKFWHHTVQIVLLRNSIAQDKLVVAKPSGTRVDFVEPQRKKLKSTPLPRIDSTMESGGKRAAMKGGASNSSRTSEDSGSHTGKPPDAMTWTSTWKMMNRTLEAFATRNTDSNDRGSGKSRKAFKKHMQFKDDSDGCIDTWVEVMRLHLEQDNLTDDAKQPRGNSTEVCRGKEGGGA